MVIKGDTRSLDSSSYRLGCGVAKLKIEPKS